MVALRVLASLYHPDSLEDTPLLNSPCLKHANIPDRNLFCCTLSVHLSVYTVSLYRLQHTSTDLAFQGRYNVSFLYVSLNKFLDLQVALDKS